METRHDRENIMNRQLAERIISIFQKPYPDRTAEENYEVLSIFQGIDFFSSKLSENIKPEIILTKCAAAMQIEFFPPGSAVYHYGEASNKIYIVIKGRVRRYAKRTIDMTADDSPKKSSKKSSKISSSANLALLQRNLSSKEVALADTQLPQSSKTHTPLISRNNSPRIGLESPITIKENSSNKDDSPKSHQAKFRAQRLKQGESQKLLSINQVETETPNQKRLTLKAKDPLNNSNSFQINLFSQAIKQFEVESSSRLQLPSSAQLPDVIPQSLAINKNAQSDNEDIFKKYRYYVFEEKPVFESFLEHRHQYFIAGEFGFIHRRTYHPGKSFGEMGTTFDSHRIATMVTETSTCLLSIDKSSFQNIFADEVKFNIDKVQFLQNLFSTVPSKYVSDFASYFRRKVISQHSAIYKQGDCTDSLFFIKEGEVLLSRQLTIARESFEKLTPRGASSEIENTVNVATLSENQILGEEELFRMPKRMFTATALSTRCVVLKISSKSFRMLRRLYAEIIERMENEFNSRLQWRYERINLLEEKAHKEAVSKMQKLEATKIQMTQHIDQIVNLNIIGENTESGSQNVYRKERILPRFTSKKLKYRELSIKEQDELERLANLKLRLAHDQVKMRHNYELYHTPPVTKIKEPLSIWRMCLKEQGILKPKVKSLFKFRYGEEESASKPQPREQNKRYNLSLDRINKSISRIIQARPLLIHELSNVKNSPSFMENSKLLSNLNESLINQSEMGPRKSSVLGNVSLPDWQVDDSLKPSRKQSIVGSALKKHSSEVSLLSSLTPNRDGITPIDTTAMPSLDNTRKFSEHEFQRRNRRNRESLKMLSLFPSKNNSPRPDQRNSIPHNVSVLPTDKIISQALQNNSNGKTDTSILLQYHYKSSYQNKND